VEKASAQSPLRPEKFDPVRAMPMARERLSVTKLILSAQARCPAWGGR
jgi:hypothetical protein